MQFIYATGQPRNMEFAVTDNTSAVPADATILATCTRGHEEEHLDEFTFAAMTDAEFYSFRALVNVARHLESQRARTTQSLLPTTTLCNRFMQLLVG